MSFELDWDKLVADPAINEGIRSFLDDQFQKVQLPAYINGLTVTDFNLGSIAPDITIRHISDPFEEFYDEDLKDIDERLNDLSTNYMNGRQGYGYGSSDDNEDENDDDDDDDNNDQDEDYSTNHSSISDNPGNNRPFTMEFPKIGGKTGAQIQKEQQQEAVRTRGGSLDSLSLMLGNNNLNFLHNHNINNLGLGNLNSPPHSSRPDTPTHFLPHKPFNSENYSNNFIKTKRIAAERDKNDIQMIVEFNYQGNLEINLMVNLMVNYPSPNFISLPIKLHITDLVVHSIAVIAYLRDSIYISVLCDVNDQNPHYFANESGTVPGSSFSSGGNFVDYVNSGNTQERIDIIKKVKIESEIGGSEQNVLRNVGKVEKFLIDRLRGLLRDEIAWPSWICIDLSDDNSSDDNEAS